MRITLKPTQHPESVEATHPTITIEIPFDHLTMHQMLEQLVVPALKGVGFCDETIDKYIDLD